MRLEEAERIVKKEEENSNRMFLYLVYLVGLFFSTLTWWGNQDPRAAVVTTVVAIIYLAVCVTGTKREVVAPLILVGWPLLFVTGILVWIESPWSGRLIVGMTILVPLVLSAYSVRDEHKGERGRMNRAILHILLTVLFGMTMTVWDALSMRLFFGLLTVLNLALYMDCMRESHFIRGDLERDLKHDTKVREAKRRMREMD